MVEFKRANLRLIISSCFTVHTVVRLGQKYSIESVSFIRNTGKPKREAKSRTVTRFHSAKDSLHNGCRNFLIEKDRVSRKFWYITKQRSELCDFDIFEIFKASLDSDSDAGAAGHFGFSITVLVRLLTAI